MENNEGYELKEPQNPYNRVFDPEKCSLRLKNDHIWRFLNKLQSYSLVRQEMPGYRKPLAVFFTINVSPQHVGKTAEKLSHYDDLVVVYQMSGRRNLHVHGYFEDIQEVYEFVTMNLDSLPGVQDISIEFLLKKFRTDFV